LNPFLPLLLLIANIAAAQNGIVVFQSDFGVKDGAVAAMKGVSSSVSPNLRLYDLTHEIPAYNIWEASLRLEQTVRYWPEGTVFVSVVDPGVGTERRSVVLKTRSGHYIVTPDNGTLTHISLSLGIGELRSIDETVNRRQESDSSYTFHGRDVYAYTAARLASHTISFEQVGPALPDSVTAIFSQPASLTGNIIAGTISILDVQFGNVWTNIPSGLFQQLNIKEGGLLDITIKHHQKTVLQATIPYHTTFGKVAAGQPLAYLNSLMQLSFAINEGDFAKKFKVASGSDWTVEVKPAR